MYILNGNGDFIGFGGQVEGQTEPKSTAGNFDIVNLVSNASHEIRSNLVYGHTETLAQMNEWGRTSKCEPIGAYRGDRRRSRVCAPRHRVRSSKWIYPRVNTTCWIVYTPLESPTDAHSGAPNSALESWPSRRCSGAPFSICATSTAHTGVK